MAKSDEEGLAQAFIDLANAEKQAMALERHLSDVERKIESLLAVMEPSQEVGDSGIVAAVDMQLNGGDTETGTGPGKSTGSDRNSK
ncbi:predicted protein [Uncinocarpus reesii 1704]|uniref:Uncharacterized protein n=1 Tax=Uncinocarpus reesii (strain UAMH 1704) TaxID=336963 RepID=C4JT35_UNCRE|nr:uncharacterized protein UREG_05624 [Uncinocarpus reesii 1704]EEP80782.1 predicted protein [Uncinocarpus reesii 1704]